MNKQDYINILITKINNMCDVNNISPNQLGIKSGVGKDIIANMQKGSIPSSDKLAKIADYLNISVDYLLGRTDELNNYSGNSIKTGDIGGNGDSSININSHKIDKTTAQIVEALETLDIFEKAKVINFIAELSKKRNEEIKNEF